MERVSISIEKVRRTRFEFIKYILDIAKEIARDVSRHSQLRLPSERYSIMPVRRMGHLSSDLIISKTMHYKDWTTLCTNSSVFPVNSARELGGVLNFSLYKVR